MCPSNEAKKGVTVDSSEKEVEEFAKGSPVYLVGLQSDAGKKLNGSQGIILGKPTVSDGVSRYPVLIWALEDKKEEIGYSLVPSMNKKIKAENLKKEEDPDSNELLQEAALIFAEHFQREERDLKKMLWWLETVYNICPTSLRNGMNYAKALRCIFNKPMEAYEVAVKFEGAVKEDDDNYPMFCHDMSMYFAKAGKRLEDALQYALQIPADNPMAFQSLESIIHACNIKIQEEDPNFHNEEVADIHLRAAKVLWERDAENSSNVYNVATAYCLAEDNLNGAKWYRRALRMGAGTTANNVSEVERKRNAVIAQMQCPSMPWENYFIYQIDGNNAWCYDKKYKDVLKLERKTQDGRVSGKLESRGDAEIRIFPIPRDPNDPEFFSAEFLAMLDAEK